MKKKQDPRKPGRAALSAQSLAAIRGGSGVRAQSGGRAGDDDDPNGGIIIIGRGGP